MNLYYKDWETNNPSGLELDLFRIINKPWIESEVNWDKRPPSYLTSTDSAQVPTSTNTWMAWDVTGDVQDYIAGDINVGWEIRDDNDCSYNCPQTIFSSKESGLNIPYLEIEIVP